MIGASSGEGFMMYSMVMALGLLAAFPAHALAPPAGPVSLCDVEGTVLKIKDGQGTDAAMQPLAVQEVSVKLRKIVPQDAKNDRCLPRDFTGKPLTVGGDMEIADKKFKLQGINKSFRLCQEIALKPGDQIRGVVGRSNGGGRDCIES